MPKILWKNILDSSRRELVLAIVMIPLFWLGITEGSFGGLNQVMYIYKRIRIATVYVSGSVFKRTKTALYTKNVQIQIPCVVYSAAFTYINHGNNQP